MLCPRKQRFCYEDSKLYETFSEGCCSMLVLLEHSLVCPVLLVLPSLLSVLLRGPAKTNTCFINVYGSWTWGRGGGQVRVTLAGRYLQGVLDILDRLVDLELQGHPKENAQETQSIMMQSDGC